MQQVRPAAVAGAFYPGAPRQLTADVRAYLAATSPSAGSAGWPKALIVPHAGYAYSGPVAASAFSRLAPGRDTIRRVVLLGPCHRVPVRGLALPAAAAFATPLGSVPVDREAVQIARALPQVVESAAAHAHEHSLEVQLPFLQSVLADFAVVPFAVGDASAEDVAEVIELLWGGRETLIVVSSDLSHYHPYAEARRIDRGTADEVLALSSTLDHEQACGATPINGFALCARRHALSSELLDLRNSGDTAGDKSRVVGYAAFAFSGDAA
jgi:MEMO1 family protein